MKTSPVQNSAVIQRLEITLYGAVQGVGFRPFVYRLANEFHLSGFTRNSPQGLTIEIEGETENLRFFLDRLRNSPPPAALVRSLKVLEIPAIGAENDFAILPSLELGGKTAAILPDLAVCDDCRREIFDPADRRFLYPFTNCTNCGPRFSIIEALPYDRANTTMKNFIMCDDCRREYENPANRRFHAQPNACPQCGPQLELWDSQGIILEKGDCALRRFSDLIKEGKIGALKGLGGFQLIVDARNENAVQTLRARKRREEKPFALMFPTLEMVKNFCSVSADEESVLQSPQSPIVLLERKSLRKTSPENITPSVAPGNPCLGVMLPYTPLHLILMRELPFPLVATSGNLSDEPICFDENEALQRLAGLADCYLVHNRPIRRHLDDSVVRFAAGRMMILRRARGFAPAPIACDGVGEGILALGAHLKNTTALSLGNEIFLSQHIGDLETEQSFRAFEESITQLLNLYGKSPQIVVHDLHPDYLSSRFAQEKYSGKTIAIQHHRAHIHACLADNCLREPALALAWDGTGYGEDGTVWGGEFFRCSKNSTITRCASFRQFPLPGGDAAVREPRRSALGILYAIFGENLGGYQNSLPLFKTFAPGEIETLISMMKSGFNSPLTSSVGRLFDAAAALLNIRQVNSFEGQAAMELEFHLNGIKHESSYQWDSFTDETSGEPLLRFNWEKIFRSLINDCLIQVSPDIISARFHNSMVNTVLLSAKEFREKNIILTGGCFQNKYLLERAAKKLREAGFQPFWHRNLPPNDGGIAFGQIAALRK